MLLGVDCTGALSDVPALWLTDAVVLDAPDGSAVLLAAAEDCSAELAVAEFDALLLTVEEPAPAWAPTEDDSPDAVLELVADVCPLVWVEGLLFSEMAAR